MNALPRRRFLRTTSFAAAAATTAVHRATHPTHATAAESAPAQRVRAGFLGVAYSHAAEKLRLLQTSSDYELVGAWPETPDLARQLESKGVPVLTQEQVLERSDVVLIESEVPAHAELAARALEAGRHVHLEKPPSTTLAAFDQVLRLAREKQRLLQVGYMWRHNPGLRALFDAVRQGWLGDVFLVRATLNNTLATARRGDWAGYPGGVLFELGSHFVDAIVRLLGPPQRVTPFLKTHGSTTDTLADSNVAVFEFARATAVLTCATLQPNASAHRTFEVMGTRGTGILRPVEPPTLTLDLAEAAGPYVKGTQTVPLPAYRRYEGELAELAAAIRTGSPLPVDLDTERHVQESLLRASGVIPASP